MSNNPTLELSDLKVTLGCLSSSVQNVMRSLHDVQTASFDAGSHRSPPISHSFTLLRKSLKAHWEGMIIHLQSYHEFGEDVNILDKCAAQEPNEDMYTLLEELVSSADKIYREGEGVLRDFDTYSRQFSALASQLSDLLRRSVRRGKPVSESHTFSIDSNRATGKVESNLPQLSEPTPFRGPSLQPDGLTAIAATTAALTEVCRNIRLLRQYWASASEVCRSLMTSNLHITQEHARRFGETWKEYQEEVVLTKASIAQSCDAVVVEAAAPPTFRRQQRRRGSSKSEKSLPASPPLLQRKLSSFDEDGVPKACWSFNMFSLGERRKG
ncbi:hypothetical protein B0H10DRAFT_2223301 [Mycena sp. CBHHK59/15]|nr:hypothetical protein B0H10DRAFT_2223301 [Mycena sp. CBHHK59/15]